jgi:hypothetical protein
MNPAIIYFKNHDFHQRLKVAKLVKSTHLMAFFLCLASNEPIQLKNWSLCIFGLKKIACEWIGNHDFDQS